MAAPLLTVPGGRGRLLWLMLFLVLAPACHSDSSREGVDDIDGGMDSGVADAAPAEPTIRLLVPGEAKLLTCTQGDPAASVGHHWCAFYRPALGGDARTELWVVDVSRALAGEPVPCDGSSSSCLRITDRLYGEEPYRYGHVRFGGDTLFFLSRETTDPNFKGFTWAWRPGWTRPRPISTDKGNFCAGSRSGQYAWCYDNWADGTFDLRAGRLIDQDNSLLPLVERISQHAGVMWSAEFTRADELFVYSSWREGEAAQALRVIPAAELGQALARTVVTDVEEWALSGDGQTVFFRRGSSPPPPLLPGAMSSWAWGPGSLWAADFPSGAEPMEIASGVMHYRPVSRSGVGFLTDPQGLKATLHIQHDWRHPESRFRMAGDASGWDSFAQGRLTQVLQSDDNGKRVIVGDNERGTTCVVPIRPHLPNNYYSVGFLPSLGALFWWEPDPADERTNVTFLARPQDCGDVRVLGKGLPFLEEVGSHGLVFGSPPANDAKVWSLFYVLSYDGRPLDTTGKLILSDVEPWPLVWVGARREALVMGTTENGASAKGLYLFGPLPPIPY